uniref:Uncharacterized protein n=1 Tax=virus sp. ctx9V1 TaxID=2828001 RepID=A0A8S5RDP4_9VIRU|nr:MAG TPA: hypothetical protein [virus sp. ctx9V1]
MRLQSFRNLLLELRSIVHLDTEMMNDLVVYLYLIIIRWHCSLYSHLSQWEIWARYTIR